MITIRCHHCQTEVELETVEEAISWDEQHPNECTGDRSGLTATTIRRGSNDVRATADLITEQPGALTGTAYPPESVPLVELGSGDWLGTLRGEHPWIPGHIFRSHPGLAEHLAKAAEEFLARPTWEEMDEAHPSHSIPPPEPCPECVQGKHDNCDGKAWDKVKDVETVCPCMTVGHPN